MVSLSDGIDVKSVFERIKRENEEKKKMRAGRIKVEDDLLPANDEINMQLLCNWDVGGSSFLPFQQKKSLSSESEDETLCTGAIKMDEEDNSADLSGRVRGTRDHKFLITEDKSLTINWLKEKTPAHLVQSSSLPSLVDSTLTEFSSLPTVADSIPTLPISTANSKNKRRPRSSLAWFDAADRYQSVSNGCPVHGNCLDVILVDPSPSCCTCNTVPPLVSYSPKRIKKTEEDEWNCRIMNEKFSSMCKPASVRPPKRVPGIAKRATCSTNSLLNKHDLIVLNEKSVSRDTSLNSIPYPSVQDSLPKEITALSSSARHTNRTASKLSSESTGSRRMPSHLIGFKNMGNTCFVNSTLQVLLAVPEFANLLQSVCAHSTNLPLTVQLLNQIAMMRTAGDSVAVQEALCLYASALPQLNPSYAGGEQHDANEFLLRVMMEIKTSVPGGPVEELFEYIMVEIHQCPMCGDVTRRARIESSLCLAIGEHSDSIDLCLEAYTAGEERSINCKNCPCRTMNVFNRFRTIPRCLVLSLNRYSNNEKIMRNVCPPDVLDLTPYLEEPGGDLEQNRFSLVGEIVHVGRLKSRGHYICFVRCQDGVWRSYDDHIIETISFRDRIQSPGVDEAAYVFFFVRCSHKTDVPSVHDRCLRLT